MKHTLQALMCLVIFSFISTSLSAKNPSKWGKLSKSEIALKEVPFDKEAHAVILNYYGEFRFLPGSEPQLEVHKRIKILDKEGLDAANVSIIYYGEKGFETITGLKAQALLIRNGKVEKVKVPASDIYEVDYGKFRKEIRFTFPGVQPGDVIEYSYGIFTKNSLSLWDFMFQHEYPVMNNTLLALIHESLGVKVFFHGTRLTKKYANGGTNEWTLTNVPALRSEPFTWNLKDYAEWVEFQLDEYYYHNDRTGIDYKTVNRSWEQVAKERMEDGEFWGYMEKSGQYRKIIEEIGADKLTGLAKAKKIYQHVQYNTTWDNVNSRYPDMYHLFKDDWKGNIASINLLLCGLLKEAGFDAQPMLASTKYHGRIVESNPVIDQFNIILGMMRYDDKAYVLNAVDPYLAFGEVREEDLNGRAFVINKDKPEWVPIENQRQPTEFVMEEVSIGEDAITRKITYKLGGLYAHDLRVELSRNSPEDIIARYLNADDNMVSDIEITNRKEIGEPLSISFVMSTPADLSGDLLLLPAVGFNVYNNNPFTDGNRMLPVDFAHTYTDTYIVNIRIPEGYTVEEMPESEKVVLRNKAGSLLFMGKQVGNMVQVQATMKINKPLFRVSEYPDLQQMFGIVVSKFAENIVLKKASSQP
ncbi:MAG: DUF3857 domain-containing protein [Cyclobacteriaceae bacterium]